MPDMSTTTALAEFRTRWLPAATDAGLRRLSDLLDRASPLLIHGSFSRCPSQGCLATHLAWHHPLTADLATDSGIAWLTKVAGLNPATSFVVLNWDRAGIHDWELRGELLAACRDELNRRDSRAIESIDEHELCGV
jgi:hypothetical protein